MDNLDRALEMLQAVADLGVHIAIDDFGTGYSSLSYLQRLPADVVKIDQSFMRGLLADARKQALVTTMVSLSHDLGYRVVVEGVETEPVLAFMKAADCDEAQGYWFSRPMPPGDFAAWFLARQAGGDRPAGAGRSRAQGGRRATMVAVATQ